MRKRCKVSTPCGLQRQAAHEQRDHIHTNIQCDKLVTDGESLVGRPKIATAMKSTPARLLRFPTLGDL